MINKVPPKVAQKAVEQLSFATISAVSNIADNRKKSMMVELKSSKIDDIGPILHETTSPLELKWSHSLILVTLIEKYTTEKMALMNEEGLSTRKDMPQEKLEEIIELTELLKLSTLLSIHNLDIAEKCVKIAVKKSGLKEEEN